MIILKLVTHKYVSEEVDFEYAIHSVFSVNALTIRDYLKTWDIQK